MVEYNENKRAYTLTTEVIISIRRVSQDPSPRACAIALDLLPLLRHGSVSLSDQIAKFIITETFFCSWCQQLRG